MAKQQTTEEELDIRRKARRRLVGAIALTLAVVVILPMVLDSEPKPTGQDINLSIPNPDKAGEFVPGVAASEVVEIPAQAVSPVEPASMPVAPLPVAVSAAPVAAPVNAPVAASKPKSVAPDKVQAATSKQHETKTAASSEGFVAQIGAYANAKAAKIELDKLKKWGFRAYTEKVGDKVRVRVGPYQDRAKAEKAGELLKKHGLHPVVLSTKDS